MIQSSRVTKFMSKSPIIIIVQHIGNCFRSNFYIQTVSISFSHNYTTGSFCQFILVYNLENGFIVLYIIIPCTIVMPVQALIRIILLTIILVRLNIRSTRKYTSERIVVVGFLHSPLLCRLVAVYCHADISLIVFQVVVIAEVV